MCSASFLTRPAIWIALAVILWASLVPSLARAFSPAHPAQRVSVEYCAPDGAGLVQIDVRADDSGQSPQHDAHEGSQHCPFCRNQQADIGILPDPAPLPLPTSLARKVSYPRSTTSRPGRCMPGARPSRAPRRPPDRPRLMHRAARHAREPRLTAPRRPPLPLPIDPPFRGRSARVLARPVRPERRAATVRSPGLPYPSATHRAAAAPAARARGIRS